MSKPPADVTGLLRAWAEGHDGALDQLVPLVYAELRAIAHRERRRERPDGTIGTTALVNEAYLRLVDQKSARLESRKHFLNLAAQVMRRILVDEARRRHAAKRGGGGPRLSVDDVILSDAPPDERLLALDDALTRLEAIDPRLKQVVELRYFGGLTIEETADVLETSRSSAWRDWLTARAWLYDTIGGQED
jgi:RNA polymerase sigma factor (TIGR02999 family)